MKALGIDPGFHGAIAMLDDENIIWVEDCPLVTVKTGKRKKSMLNLPRMIEILNDAKQAGVSLAVLEKVGPMPKQGVTSSFRFGEASMAWQMGVMMAGIPCIRPRPQAWKKVMLKDIPGDAGKGRSILAAQALFPSAPLMKTSRCKVPSPDRAEAILMAVYGIRIKKGTT